MISVPGFLLRRLYVKGSMRNNDQGFEFQLKNQLGSGYAKRLMPLTLDGQELPMESSFFFLEGQGISFAQVSEDNPFTLAMNRTITIKVHNVHLDKGPHKIGVSFNVQGFGNLSFDFVDAVADE